MFSTTMISLVRQNAVLCGNGLKFKAFVDHKIHVTETINAGYQYLYRFSLNVFKSPPPHFCIAKCQHCVVLLTILRTKHFENIV